MFGLPTPLLVIGGCLAVGALGMLGALFLWGKTVKDNKGTFFQDQVLPAFQARDETGDYAIRPYNARDWEEAEQRKELLDDDTLRELGYSA